MKYHVALKFIAIVLCACSLLVSVASGVGIGGMIALGLYESSVEELQQDRMENVLDRVANELAGRYAASNLSNCPEEFVEQYYGSWYTYQLSDPDLWYYTIKDSNGQVLHTSHTSQDTAQATAYEYVVAPHYPVILSYGANGENRSYDLFTAPMAETEETVSRETGSKESEFIYSTVYQWEDDHGNYHEYDLGFRNGPAYLVTVYVLPGAYTLDSSFEWELLHLAYGYRYTLFLPLAGGLLLFAVLLVYLCCAAARRPKSDEVRPGGLNMLPIDLYSCLLLGLGAALTVAAVELLENYLLSDSALNWGVLWVGALLCAVICLLIVAFFFALAAQLKPKGLYWWHHSLVGIAVTLCWRILKWCWKLLGKLFGGLYRGVSTLLGALPLVWQWLLGGVVLLVLMAVGILSRNGFVLLVMLAVCAAAVLYGAWAFGKLLKSAGEMSRGNLNQKVEQRGMVGSFRDFAGHLDALADVATLAAQKQMKSERMKAELITNVSHDIKTPLTSIINYVDLLQKSNSPEESREYLDVLDRQSQRLKKLIDDLMDMSKASTGNMPVELTETDAVETVTQALGEFADKLAAARLTPIFNPPTEPMPILADGRVTWRVLSNLLGNAVKYALPGTRLYVDIVKLEGNVLVSVKNISAEPLNVSSEELMERFVRGDASRNTEGSGLGLNIAQSLMELQHGQLRLLIDGDLFKATLVFPGL